MGDKNLIDVGEVPSVVRLLGYRALAQEKKTLTTCTTARSRTPVTNNAGKVYEMQYISWRCVFVRDRPHEDVLVVENQVGPPHQAAGDVDHFQSVVVLFVPAEVGVVPLLPDPQVGDQHLVPLVLDKAKGHRR